MAATHALVSRALAAVDARIVAVLSQDESAADSTPRVELALLGNLRRGLHGQSLAVQDDVVLCDTLVEFSEAVQLQLTDLQAGGKRRLRRLVDYSRELVTQLRALSRSDPTFEACLLKVIRPQASKVTVLLEKLPEERQSAGQLKLLIQEMLALYRRVCDELEQRSPRTRSSMLDVMTRL